MTMMMMPALGVFPDTLGKISDVSSIALPVLDLDDAFGAVDSTARSVSHSQKQCVGHHSLTAIFVCDILEFSKICHSNGCGKPRTVSCNVAYPIFL